MEKSRTRHRIPVGWACLETGHTIHGRVKFSPWNKFQPIYTSLNTLPKSKGNADDSSRYSNKPAAAASLSTAPSVQPLFGGTRRPLIADVNWSDWRSEIKIILRTLKSIDKSTSFWKQEKFKLGLHVNNQMACVSSTYTQVLGSNKVYKTVVHVYIVSIHRDYQVCSNYTSSPEPILLFWNRY